jgi:hypothetical protein
MYLPMVNIGLKMVLLKPKHVAKNLMYYGCAKTECTILFKNIDGSRNVTLLAVQSRDAADLGLMSRIHISWNRAVGHTVPEVTKGRTAFMFWAKYQNKNSR